jgi:hypothetical protein
MTEAHLQDLELSAYLDGETDAAARPRVEAHLAACAACRDALSGLRALQAGLREVPVPEPEASYWTEFAERVEARIEATSAVPRAKATSPTRGYERLTGWLFPSGHFGWVRAAGALAALTLVTVVGLRGVGDLAVRAPARSPKPETALEAPGSLAENAAREPLINPPPGSTRPSSPQPTSTSDERFALDKKQAATGTGSAVGGQQTKADAGPRADHALAGRVEESRPGAPAAEAVAPSQPGQPPPVVMEWSGVSGAAPPPTPAASSVDREPGSIGLRRQAAAAPETVSVPGGTADLANRGPADSALPRDRIVALLEAGPSSAPAAPTEKLKSLLGKERPSLDKDEKSNANLQVRMAVPANELESAVQRFVGAALEADTAQAREVYAALGASAAPGTGEALNAMRRWLDALPRAPAAGVELDRGLRMRNSAPATGAEPWLALDALVWPRRDAPQLQGAAERLARELAASAPSDARARDRARAWLQWLAVRAPDPATRSRWDELLRRLP